MGWVDKMRRPPGEGGRPPDAVDGEWLSLLPALHEFLTLGRHPDGSTRRTATLTIFVDCGAFKTYLNERETGCSLCASGASVNDALSALEVLLEGENPPWRFSEQPPSPGPRKRR